MRRLGLVARKDVRDSVRTRQLHVTLALFTLVAIGIGYLLGSNSARAPSDVPTALLGLLLFLAPLTAIVLSYDAIVGKRLSGELTVLLGLPFSRRAVVVGTLVGRFLVVSILVVTTILVGAGVSLGVGSAPSPFLLVGASVAALTLALAFVALSVGISANTRNTTRASGLAFGVFLLFVFRLWDALPVLGNQILDRLSLPTLPAAIVDLYLQLAPHAAVRNLIEPAFPALGAAFGASVSVPPGGAGLGLIVLLGWILGPLLLGYYRFKTADI